jgi:endoglucanase
VRLYVNPDAPATRVARDLAGGDPAQARVLGRLGATPQAIWFGDWITADKVAGRVRAVAEAATSSATVPLFVIYNVPHRDCGQHSAGGAPDASAYRSWVLAFAAGIGQAKAFVVIEPDALAQLDCLSAAQRAERLELLRFAVDALSTYPSVVSYLDAGHHAWTAPTDMAHRLRDADIRKIRGFSVNVSFYDTTADEITYGKTVSDLVGHKPFVIDTSRNGSGRTSGPSRWCNPPDRALGPTPLTAPGDDRVDALLWIKTPGVSDGDCGRGEPPAGQFWTKRAVELATAAGW